MIGYATLRINTGTQNRDFLGLDVSLILGMNKRIISMIRGIFHTFS
jgi:hypothetical protein